MARPVAARVRRAQTEPARRTAKDIAKLSPADLYALLPDERRRAVMNLVGATLTRVVQPSFSGSIGTPSRDLIQEFCEAINALGIPLDRYVSSTSVLTPDHDAMGRVWTRAEGVVERVYVRPQGEDSDYIHSPFFEAATTGEWVDVWLPDTPDDRYGIVPDLKRGGYVHYLCAPFKLTNGGDGWITVATQSTTGFGTQDVAALAIIFQAITRTIDARVGWLTLDGLLRTYVGDEPHKAILAGNVKRGQVSTISSAILFADMRDSTGHTASLSAPEAVELFNGMFDRLVPPIEARGGEVLKYMGDGLLAIFRGSHASDFEAVGLALDAGQEALARMAAFNADRPGRRPVEIGIALHYGEAAYGNVGSGLRLDFTVIGRDIGLASRIGALNARLGQPLLMSQAFVERLGRPVVPLGAFAARGFDSPLAVFRPI